MKRYKLKPGETVDSIAWNYYGYTSGVVEAIFEANPGLSAHAAVFRYEDLYPETIALSADEKKKFTPLINEIVLPDVQPDTSNQRVRLWD